MINCVGWKPYFQINYSHSVILWYLLSSANINSFTYSLGKQLEDSGVLNESLRSRSNSWGLHMPLVCPDGAVVAYAWKRQLAGQAGASAVDRTRWVYLLTYVSLFTLNETILRKFKMMKRLGISCLKLFHLLIDNSTVFNFFFFFRFSSCSSYVHCERTWLIHLSWVLKKTRNESIRCQHKYLSVMDFRKRNKWNYISLYIYVSIHRVASELSPTWSLMLAGWHWKHLLIRRSDSFPILMMIMRLDHHRKNVVTSKHQQVARKTSQAN